MSSLERWAKEKKCCCPHPERHACAEELDRRSWLLDDVARSFRRQGIDEIEPCECHCHDEFFSDDEDD